MSMTSLGAHIGASFWESRGLQCPQEEFEAYPTMLTVEEMRMLFAIASHPALPPGDIVDLGSFMGGSSTSLAAGVKGSSAERMVHSYDQFGFNENAFVMYLMDHPRLPELREAGYGVELFHALTTDYAAHIEVHVGDVVAQSAPAEIALCFVDLDKSIDLNRTVVQKHFSQLVPGAIVVQQDFFFTKTPWTMVTMHRLADIMPVRGATKDNSAVFELTGQLTNERLEAAVADGMTTQEVEAAYRFFIDASPRLYHREILELALHRYHDTPNLQAAWDYASPFPAMQFYIKNFASKL